MIRFCLPAYCLMLVCACASIPETAVEDASNVLAGAPTGLAWIPPSGEVAIRGGSVEHVLYPKADPSPSRQTPADPSVEVSQVKSGQWPPKRASSNRYLNQPNECFAR